MYRSKSFRALMVLLLIQTMIVPALARLPENLAPKIKISILPIEQNPKTQRVLMALRAELQRDPNLQVLSLPNAPQLYSLNSSMTPAQVSVDFKEALHQAQELYRDFSFSKAAAVLQKAIDDYSQSEVAVDKLLPFSQVYAMMANVYLADQNTAKAKEAFSRALQFDPQYTISEREYPPSTVRVFQEVQQDFLQKKQYARLEIQSNPKAQVYLNGALRGETPLKLAKQPMGEQWILLVRQGYRSEKLKIDLTTANFKKKIELAESKQPFDSLGGISTESQRLRTLSRWGHENGLDHIVTVQSDGNNKIKIESIHVAKARVENQYSFDYAKLSREVVNVRQNLAPSFEKLSNPSIASTAEAPATSEKPKSAKKKSIFKKPWLWGVLGAVVARGAASAFLIGGGGDGGSGSITTTVRGSQSPSP